MSVAGHASTWDDVLTATQDSVARALETPTPPAVANHLVLLVMGPHPNLSSRQSRIAIR